MLSTSQRFLFVHFTKWCWVNRSRWSTWRVWWVILVIIISFSWKCQWNINNQLCLKDFQLCRPPPPAPALSSLRRRSNVTLVSNVWEAAPRSLFWPPNGFNEEQEVCFEFLFILIGKSAIAFLTGQSLRLLKSWYPCGPGTRISALFRRRLWRRQPSHPPTPHHRVPAGL